MSSQDVKTSTGQDSSRPGWSGKNKGKTKFIPIQPRPEKSVEIGYKDKKTIQVIVLGGGQESFLTAHPYVQDSNENSDVWALSRPEAYDAYLKNRIHPGMARVLAHRKEFLLKKFSNDNPGLLTMSKDQGPTYTSSKNVRRVALAAAKTAASARAYEPLMEVYNSRISKLSKGQKKPKPPGKPSVPWKLIREHLNHQDAEAEGKLRTFLNLPSEKKLAAEQHPDLHYENTGGNTGCIQEVIPGSKGKNIREVRGMILNALNDLSFLQPRVVELDKED